MISMRQTWRVLQVVGLLALVCCGLTWTAMAQPPEQPSSTEVPSRDVPTAPASGPPGFKALLPGMQGPLSDEARRGIHPPRRPESPSPADRLASPDPRRVLYPAPQQPGVFGHRDHPMPCVRCHASALAAGQAGQPISTPCAHCHDDQRQPPGPPGASAALRFDHGAHAALGLSCDRCHAGVEQSGPRSAAPDAPDFRPDMAACLTCHDGEQAPDRCGTCHLRRPDGRVLTDLPSGRLVPWGRVRPGGDHRGDFTRRHGPLAHTDRAWCDACHTEASCQTCHLAGPRPETIHPADFILSHSPQARRDNPRCASCHRQQTFCRDCHLKSGLGVLPGRHQWGADGTARGRYHPEGFTGVPGLAPGPGHHRYEARRNLQTCVSCHSEASCQRCHSADTAPGLRASPHPPGFSRHCGTARRRNEGGCLKCHDPEGLARLCGP